MFFGILFYFRLYVDFFSGSHFMCLCEYVWVCYNYYVLAWILLIKESGCWFNWIFFSMCFVHLSHTLLHTMKAMSEENNPISWSAPTETATANIIAVQQSLNVEMDLRPFRAGIKLNLNQLLPVQKYTYTHTPFACFPQLLLPPHTSLKKSSIIKLVVPEEIIGFMRVDRICCDDGYCSGCCCCRCMFALWFDYRCALNTCYGNRIVEVSFRMIHSLIELDDFAQHEQSIIVDELFVNKHLFRFQSLFNQTFARNRFSTILFIFFVVARTHSISPSVSVSACIFITFFLILLSFWKHLIAAKYRETCNTCLVSLTPPQMISSEQNYRKHTVCVCASISA